MKSNTAIHSNQNDDYFCLPFGWGHIWFEVIRLYETLLFIALLRQLSLH